MIIIFFIIQPILLVIFYKIGWNHGVDFIIDYFTTHPIPKEWIEND